MPCLPNFKIAAGLEKGKHTGANWGDGDCCKWIETAAHVYAITKDEQLDRLMDEWIGLIAKAQAPDGYISTNIQLTGRKRLANPHHHEIYNMDHPQLLLLPAPGHPNHRQVAQLVLQHLRPRPLDKPLRLQHP